MKFRMVIECDNAAFFSGDGEESMRGAELARILRRIAGELERDDDSPRGSLIWDSNGNRVGDYQFSL